MRIKAWVDAGKRLGMRIEKRKMRTWSFDDDLFLARLLDSDGTNLFNENWSNLLHDYWADLLDNLDLLDWPRAGQLLDLNGLNCVLVLLRLLAGSDNLSDALHDWLDHWLHECLHILGLKKRNRD